MKAILDKCIQVKSIQVKKDNGKKKGTTSITYVIFTDDCLWQLQLPKSGKYLQLAISRLMSESNYFGHLTSNTISENSLFNISCDITTDFLKCIERWFEKELTDIMKLLLNLEQLLHYVCMNIGLGDLVFSVGVYDLMKDKILISSNSQLEDSMDSDAVELKDVLKCPYLIK
ncbi:uncharacterized protein BX663DRAFT_487059 [Cokeromyces recurvatus]|uniref:uncharacterized protein n=1 Tax=Cokeromyces recurvatus TaxID=90255 RepID=UPI00221F51FE|nr:uncharacterized protein BX663DRAFT_487059 [Cokeromyces recurvatus]KAI7902273.1 hypothetical protein BX663DRAFT_487059 [Cokeromyces recurvatus]